MRVPRSIKFFTLTGKGKDGRQRESTKEKQFPKKAMKPGIEIHGRF
jgi:hypothetical protein